jgi:molybdenum cofactor cytidylyltransferase
MKLAQALRLSSAKTVAFAGAGGKTTAMFQLAKELAPCIVTTTTHLGAWQIDLADRHFIVGPDEDQMIFNEIEALAGNGVTLVTGIKTNDERFAGPSDRQLLKLKEMAGYHDLPLLIEADGARQKPLKAPADHEPAIPDFADVVVIVASLSGLGKPLTEEWVHRAEAFGQLGNCELGKPITPEALMRVLTHPQGGLKNIPPKSRRMVLLNDADSHELQAQAHNIVESLLSAFHAVLVTVLLHPVSPVFARYEKIAGVILAAGESSRLGRPKQLLDYFGKPFIRQVAETALFSGLDPVIVVTGAHADEVTQAISDLPVRIVYNENWKEGQSTSIREGLLPLTPLSSESQGEGGAIFLLADQPQVTTHLIRALIEHHAVDGSPITAPLVADRRANPVLFDRETFDDLKALTGDVGGRAIFTKHKVAYVTWHDESMLLDVDTVDDYRKLLAWGRAE